jgi:hypothetical protein
LHAQFRLSRHLHLRAMIRRQLDDHRSGLAGRNTPGASKR